MTHTHSRSLNAHLSAPNITLDPILLVGVRLTQGVHDSGGRPLEHSVIGLLT